MDIMLNLPDINNFLFFLKKGPTSTTFSKEKFIPRIENKKW